MADITTVMDRPGSMDFSDPSSYHDRVFIVGRVKFYLYSGVLSLWSEHFRTMFTGNFIEATNKSIEIKEVDADIFKKYLQILYDNHCKLEGKDLTHLIGISYRFLTPRVLDFCMKFIDENFSKLDSLNLELLRTACFYDIKDLKKKTTDNFMNQKVISKFKVADVVDLVMEYGLEDLKKHFSPFIFIFTLVWTSSAIAKEQIIEFVQLAFKYNVENLKTRLRKRIAELCRYNIPHSEKFLVKYYEEIKALPENIKDFIILSAVTNPQQYY